MFDIKLKRIFKVSWVSLLLLLLLPAWAFANNRGEEWHRVLFTGDSAMSGDYVVLKEGVTAKGPGFYAGKTVRLDGSVDGTAFAAGQEVTVNGDINGDLFAAGQEVTINGKVNGNLYAAGQKILVKGQVTGDAFVAGEKAETAGESVFMRDMIGFAATINHFGQVKRQMIADSHNAVISGSVSDNARLAVDNLEIRDDAEIKGELVYISPKEASISDQAKISGGTEWKKSVPRTVREKPEKTFAGQLVSLIIGIAGALLVWFIGTALKPGLWAGIIKPIFDEPGKTMGVGALVLILVPVLAIILMITVIGLPVGILLILAYGIALYLAKIIVAVFVGSWLAGRFNWPVLHKGVWLVLLGLAIIAVLTRLPFVGFLFTLLIIFWGLGTLTLTFIRPRTVA